MSVVPGPDRGRRAFLRFLASSPLFASAGALAAVLQDDFVISMPEEALNVLEFEAAARKALPPAHWGYLATGVDDEATLKADREGFSHYQLRPRRLVDVSTIDMSVDLFGTQWETPIALAPCGTIFHPEGAYAVARAAQTRQTLQILASGQERERPIEQVMNVRGGPVWYQLYASQDMGETLQTVKRVESAGAPVMVWTVDNLAGRNTETTQRLRRLDTRQCASCHTTAPRIGRPGGTPRQNRLTWDALRRIKDATSMNVLVKGIVTSEDAELCVQYGADGIVVSNHGGRSTETGRAAVDCLPEVVRAVRGRGAGVGGRRFSPRHRCVQGPRVRSARDLHRSTVSVGSLVVWSDRRRDRLVPSPARAPSRDGAVRDTFHRRDRSRLHRQEILTILKKAILKV